MPLSLMNGESTNGPSLDLGNVHASVLRALESEQAAHEATRAQLEHEVNARHEAEAETMRLAECNKGLINSINLLKSTVRHMVSKETNTLPDQASLDRAVKEYHKDVENKNPTGSILYDVLSNYKTTASTVKNNQGAISTFNLDLLNTPDVNDKSEKAQLQRTLRRQMGLSDSEHMKKLKEDYQHKIESIVRGDGPLLPDFSNTANVETRSLTPPFKVSVQVSEQKSTPTKLVAYNTPASPEKSARLPEHTLAPSQPSAHNAPPPSNIMLELPASFLSKYGKKKIDDEEPILPPLETPHKTSITTRCAIKPHKYDLDSDRAVKSSKLIWMPDCPLIDWKIDNRHRDELRGKVSFVQTRTSDSHFLDYPLRYSKSTAANNVFLLTFQKSPMCWMITSIVPS